MQVVEALVKAEPAGQVAQALAPEIAKVAPEQAAHCEALDAPSEPEAVPAGQGVQATLPAAAE